MRIYGSAYELISEVLRDLDEMGTIVKPKSYQNKDIEGKEEFFTKEIQNYVYSLVSMGNDAPLFVFEDTKDWADAEFLERIEVGTFENPGEAWKLREDKWSEFLVMNKPGDKPVFDYCYNHRINPGLDAIIQELRRNPDSRQAWLPIFHEYDLDFMGGTKRIPCSLGYGFMEREGKLNLTYIQRSADAVAHFGNDIYLAWRMMNFVARQLGVEPGVLTHHIFSLHSYARDWDKLKKGIYMLATDHA